MPQPIEPSRLHEMDKLHFPLSPPLAEVDVEKRDVVTASLLNGRVPVTLLLKGYLATEGITFLSGDYEGEAGPKEKHSFGMRLEEEDDDKAVDGLLDLLEAADPKTDFGTWTTRPVFKNGVVYLTCKTNRDGDRFEFTSNLPVAPKQQTPGIMRDMPVEARVGVNAYFGVKDSTRGLSLVLRDVQFVGAGHEPSVKEEPIVVAATEEEQQAPAKPGRKRNTQVRPTARPFVWEYEEKTVYPSP